VRRAYRTSNGILCSSLLDIGGWCMRVELKMEGGLAYFPGLSKPILIDSTVLPEDEAQELRRLVEASRLFERPTIISAPRRGAADYRQYTITVEDGERRHTVKLVDPVTDHHLQALLRFLQTKAKVLRRRGQERSSDPGSQQL